MKVQHAKPLPKAANEKCIKCNKLFPAITPVYLMGWDSMGRHNCKCIACVEGE